MMKTRRLNSWIAAMAAILLLAGFQANAQRGRGPGYGYRNDDHGRPFNRMEEMLDLTDEQKTEVDKLQLDFQKETLAMRNQIREKNAQLSTLVSEGAEEGRINSLVEEIGNLRTGMQKSMISKHMKVRNLLTDDQKVIFDNHFANRPGNPGHARCFGRGGRGWN